MVVRLDNIPLPAQELDPPRVWLWILLLPVSLLLGLGLTLWLGRDALAQSSVRFWLLALGAPFLLWCVLGFVRALLYLTEQSVADGWNAAREAELVQKMRQGRRSQQVLAVSLHTALRDPEAQDGWAQLLALQGDRAALRSQTSGERSARQSRLPRQSNEEQPEQLLLRVLSALLADLATPLAALPADRPLALLLEMHSSLCEPTLQRVWQQAWQASGIRQTATLVEGRGLSVMDRWLDQRIDEQALLLVVALQLAPADARGTAEAAVGLLFGNRLTQSTLAPLAYLHRPEPAAGAEDVLYATRQALDWVPLEAVSIGRAWMVGGDAERAKAITTAVNEIPLLVTHQQNLHDLDSCLGRPGGAAPWVGIAAAVESIRDKAEPQLIFSGDSAAAWLWCSVAMPVAPSSNRDI
ncbi:hypothetical protein [Pseudomonas panipatensis]|uniref:Uncharacterized protein n=1 Tax=Pseudomonas panipatensis TaxID=428992 RepID=A0A1G8M7Z8_9PSED|nr:hypothetical protein [Pseudomonas panipatensis]SDI64052.1 hypothetical protein SAMN05216272_1145 [Pseudomonas panipatensis]SMP76432.1 hypothetical protein SAMN06295951_1156 [Pseudomonas panipatensis]